MTSAAPSFADEDPIRLLVVGAGRRVEPGWVSRVRARCPELSVAEAESYLSGIAQLSSRKADTVLVAVDPGHAQLENAVAGLRVAAGDEARLILCCTPDAEPLARKAARCGATDYALWPVTPREIDALLGRAKVQPPAPAAHPPAASMKELEELGAVLSALGGKPMALLARAASLVRMAMDAPGAMIVVDGAAATDGANVVRPVLTAALQGKDAVRGQLAVNERPGRPYTPGDALKLSQYAELLSSILTIASAQRHWRRMAMTDECSGLPNRRELLARLNSILARAATERFAVTVLFFDLDDFKSYNDRFGHQAGDEIIRVVGQLFRQHCREQDVIARYGGDEFAVVFWDPEGPRTPGSQHPDCALSVLERFTAALRSARFPMLGPGGQGTLTISGGLATYPWDATTAEGLIQRADEALLAAKRAGKNRILLIGEKP